MAVESAEALEKIEVLKEAIFTPTGRQRKDVPPATLNAYMDLRDMFKSSGEDVSEYPLVEFPKAGPELREAQAKDPNLCWDLKRRKY